MRHTTHIWVRFETLFNTRSYCTLTSLYYMNTVIYNSSSARRTLGVMLFALIHNDAKINECEKKHLVDKKKYGQGNYSQSLIHRNAI